MRSHVKGAIFLFDQGWPFARSFTERRKDLEAAFAMHGSIQDLDMLLEAAKAWTSDRLRQLKLQHEHWQELKAMLTGKRIHSALQVCQR